MKRFEAQLLEGMAAGRDLLLSNAEDQARESGVEPKPVAPVAPVPAEPARPSGA